jgi:hypothetical protein
MEDEILNHASTTRGQVAIRYIRLIFNLRSLPPTPNLPASYSLFTLIAYILLWRASAQVRTTVNDAKNILDDHDDNTINTNTRLLKALLEHAPTSEGIWVIASDIIVASEKHDGLAQLAEFYTTGLLLSSESSCNGDRSVGPDLYGCSIVKASGRTPQVYFHPSRGVEVKSVAEDIAADLESAKRDMTTLKKYVSLESSLPLIRHNCNAIDSSSRWIPLCCDA